MIMDKLHIITFNVKGLKDDLKRMKFFTWCRTKKLDIICIQEAHCELSTIEKWKEEWQGDIIASYGTNNSKGTCIMFRPNLEYKLISEKI